MIIINLHRLIDILEGTYPEPVRAMDISSVVSLIAVFT